MRLVFLRFRCYQILSNFISLLLVCSCQCRFKEEQTQNGKNYEELYEDDNPKRSANRHPLKAFIIEQEYLTQVFHLQEPQEQEYRYPS